MNKWQIICPLVAVLLVGTIFTNLQLQSGRRALVSAVTNQVNGHALNIEKLLIAFRGRSVMAVEDAVFQELQPAPSTSLISRSMIKVATTTSGDLECAIDTSSLGIPSRTIRSSR